jgi:hypothetical protein
MREKTKNEIKKMYLEYESFTDKYYDFGITIPADYHKYCDELQAIVLNVCKRLKKLETLANANDYEFITETKLIKKSKGN